MSEPARLKQESRVFLVLTPEHRHLLSPILMNRGLFDAAAYQYFWFSNTHKLKPASTGPHKDTIFISAGQMDAPMPPEVAACLRHAIVICLYDTPPQAPDKLISLGVDEFIAAADLNPERLNFVFKTARSRLRCAATAAPTQLDEITGLPGRVGFESLLQQRIDALKMAENDDFTLAVMLLNLKSFNTINNHYGPRFGDEILLRTKERIRRVVGAKAVVARVGGDEFGIIIERVFHAVELTRVATALLEIVATPVIFGKETVALGSRIGVAHYPRAGTNAANLLRSAAIALKSAQTKAADNYRFFNKEMELESRGRFMLEKQLKAAIANGGLELYYQPRIDIQANRVVGAEALIRWNHPDHGLLAPDTFIPIAEESDLIIELGYWILARACQDWLTLAEWGVGDIHLAINLSFKQFHDPDLVEKIREIIRRYPINPLQLEFELTETTVLHNADKVLEAMHAISADGIRFSLDDFGTGYSSFAHIADLPITLLKVDRSFVNGMESQPVRAEIVESIIALAHRLNLQVVSEGVESDSQKNRLIDMNCDQCQGYLFSRPLPFDTLCQYLAQARAS